MDLAVHGGGILICVVGDDYADWVLRFSSGGFGTMGFLGGVQRVFVVEFSIWVHTCTFWGGVCLQILGNSMIFVFGHVWSKRLVTTKIRSVASVFCKVVNYFVYGGGVLFGAFWEFYVFSVETEGIDGYVFCL